MRAVPVVDLLFVAVAQVLAGNVIHYLLGHPLSLDGHAPALLLNESTYSRDRGGGGEKVRKKESKRKYSFKI